GKMWHPQTVRRTLISDRISGSRNGVAGWPALIPADLQAHAIEILRDPHRPPMNDRTPRHLLAGIVYCGTCGGRLASSMVHGALRYVCNTRPGSRGCGRIAIGGPNADAEVKDQALKALASPALADALLVDVAAARDY